MSAVKRASGHHYCQHSDHSVAVVMPAEYRETEGAQRFLCETHALPAIAEFGLAPEPEVCAGCGADATPDHSCTFTRTWSLR